MSQKISLNKLFSPQCQMQGKNYIFLIDLVNKVLNVSYTSFKKQRDH